MVTQEAPGWVMGGELHEGLLKPPENGGFLCEIIAKELSGTPGVQSVTYGAHYVESLFDSPNTSLVSLYASFVQVHPKMAEKRFGPFVRRVPATSFKGIEDLLVGKGMMPAEKQRHPLWFQHRNLEVAKDYQPRLVAMAIEFMFLIYGKIEEADLIWAEHSGGSGINVISFLDTYHYATYVSGQQKFERVQLQFKP